MDDLIRKYLLCCKTGPSIGSDKRISQIGFFHLGIR